VVIYWHYLSILLFVAFFGKHDEINKVRSNKVGNKFAKCLCNKKGFYFKPKTSNKYLK